MNKPTQSRAADQKRKRENHKRLLADTKNRKCGKKPVAIPFFRKGSMLAALNLWLVKNGEGQCPITRAAHSNRFLFSKGKVA
jgi:hypothetical protein